MFSRISDWCCTRNGVVKAVLNFGYSCGVHANRFTVTLSASDPCTHAVPLPAALARVLHVRYRFVSPDVKNVHDTFFAEVNFTEHSHGYGSKRIVIFSCAFTVQSKTSVPKTLCLYRCNEDLIGHYIRRKPLCQVNVVR